MPYVGSQPTVGNFVKLDAITTSATATYNLTNGGIAYSPQSANNCIVSLNGVIQEPTSSGNVGGFTISGSTIVFTSALTSLDVIDFILVLGDVLNIGTPSDATVGFAKVTSNLITGATAETTIAGGDSVLIYDDSASALRKMTRTNFVSGLGGLSEADHWRINANITFTGVGQSVVTTDWERADTDGFGLLGTGLSESSGTFSFPSTGYYYLNFFATFYPNAARTYLGFYPLVTLDNSSYTSSNEMYTSSYSSGVYATMSGSFIIKVTDTTNIKFKLNCERSDTTQLLGHTTISQSGFSCIKLAGI